MAGVVTTVVVPSAVEGPVDGLDYHVGLAYYPEGDDVARWDLAEWDDPGAVWMGEPPVDDVSCNVTQLRITRGRDQPLDRFRPGTCTFTLYDPDGLYSPWRTRPNPTGYTAIRPGIEVVVWIDDGVEVRYRFRGVVDSIVDSFPDPGVADSHEVTFEAFDYLGVVAAFDGFELPEQGAGETAGARVTRILANAYYRGSTALDAGTVALQGTTLAKNALDEIGLVMDTELGAFYADRSGVLVFRDRNGLLSDSRYVDVQAIFGEQEPEICYREIELADDLKKLRNDVSIANEGGTAHRAVEQTSIGLYRPRTYRRFDLIHVDPAESTTIANAHIDAYAYAAARVEGFTVDLVQLSAADRLVVLDLDLLWRIQIRRRAQGFQVVADLQIQAIGEAVDAHSWTLTLETFDASAVLDVARWDVDAWDSGLWGY